MFALNINLFTLFVFAEKAFVGSSLNCGKLNGKEVKKIECFKDWYDFFLLIC